MKTLKCYIFLSSQIFKKCEAKFSDILVLNCHKNQRRENSRDVIRHLYKSKQSLNLFLIFFADLT